MKKIYIIIVVSLLFIQSSIFCNNTKTDKFHGVWTCIENYDKGKNKQNTYLVINKINDKYLIFFIDFLKSFNNRLIIGEYDSTEDIIKFKIDDNDGYIGFGSSLYYDEALAFFIYMYNSEDIIFIRSNEKDLKLK